MEACIQTYMKRIGLHPDCLEPAVEVPELIRMMELGLRETDAGLEMLPCYLRPQLDPARVQERFLVIDAGGTNLRCALVEVGPEGERILDWNKQPLPGTLAAKQASVCEADAFFETLARPLLPWLGQSRKLGLCFSFAVEILPDREGVVAHLSKELHVQDLVGAALGERLRAALKRLGDSGELEVVVLNDTLAALLSVMPEVEARGLEAPVCMIHGTGFNLCYAEPRSWRAGIAPQLINTESGMHRTVAEGLADRRVDAQSKEPGKMRYEKMVSGAYLGRLGDTALRGAAGLLPEWMELGVLESDCCEVQLTSKNQAGSLMSSELAERLAGRATLTNQEISLFLADPENGPLSELAETQEDRTRMQEIFECLYRRTVRALVIQLEAVLEHTDLGRDRPASLVVEGTTFYQSTGLRAEFERACAERMQAVGRKVVFLPVRENSNLFGSALAWQTQFLETVCE